MKFIKQIIFILIIFLKTETLLSENSLFSVNNIQVEKTDKITNKGLADLAIKKGFNQLISKILLKNDIDQLQNLDFATIRRLVNYYQVASTPNEDLSKELVNFSVMFDKGKIHDLFYKKGISYSEISDKDLFVLPILIKNDEIFIFNNNLFYKNWNQIKNNELIEFILPLENIEIIENISRNKENLLDLNLEDLFREYSNKNLAVVLIEDNKSGNEKVYIKTRINGKKISKNINLNSKNLKSEKFYEKAIVELRAELINLVKSVNLIDIRTPSFLNVELNLNNKSNLVLLKSRIKTIDSIENIFVQEFNKDSMRLRIKYLGKLQKIIDQLKNKKVDLKLVNDQWIIKTL